MGRRRADQNWTYVDDIVSGTIGAAEHINDGTSINLGTMERIKVKDCATSNRYPEPRSIHQTPYHKPTGPLNRVASNKLAHKLLGWSPQTKFADGLQQTIDWYVNSKSLQQASKPYSQVGWTLKPFRPHRNKPKNYRTRPSAGWTGFDIAVFGNAVTFSTYLFVRTFLPSTNKPSWTCLVCSSTFF